MAFRRKTYRRKTFRKKSPVSTKRIKEIARSVVRSQAETKTRTSSQNETTLNTLTASTREHTPCRIRSGVLENERIGNEVTLTGIDVRGYLHNNSTTDVIHVRCLAFVDKQKNGAATDLTELLMSNNAPVSHAQGSMSSVLAINKQRYRVFWDQVITLAPKAAGNGSGHVRSFRRFIKPTLKLKYNDETDSSITQNDMKIVFYASEADGDVNFGEIVELYSQCIGYYKDM